MLTSCHNSCWSATLCLAVVAGSGHIPISKVTLLSPALDAGRQTEVGADAGLQPSAPHPEDRDESESSPEVAPAVGCDAWDRAGRTASARLTTLLDTVHRARLHLPAAPRLSDGPVAPTASVHLTLPRAASRPNRAHAPPQRG